MRGPSRGPGVVGRPSRKAGKGREAIPEGRKGSGGTEGVGSPPRRDGRIGRPSKGAREGWEALLECRDGSGVSPEVIARPGGVEMDGRGQEDIQEDLEGSGGPL